MEIKINVPDRFAEEARAHGVSVEVYVQEILLKQDSEASAVVQLESIHAAVDKLRELRKGNTLDGLKIKDLIHEGHKY